MKINFEDGDPPKEMRVGCMLRGLQRKGKSPVSVTLDHDDLRGIYNNPKYVTDLMLALMPAIKQIKSEESK